MALITPILTSTSPFPATSSHDFTFSVSSGDQVVRSNLVIQNNSTGVEIYNGTIESFQLKHTVNANVLTNGSEYRAKIRTGNISNQWSNYSEWIVFWALANQVVTFTNISEGSIVYNSTVTLTGTYTQANGELLESYRFLLYDENENLIKTYSEQFGDGSLTLEQEVAGLENNVLYHAEIKTVSIHNQTGTTGLISFKSIFVAPHLSSALTVTNEKNQGSIKISATLVQIIGQVDSGTISYINSDWIDLTSGQISFQEGFNIQSDFILKLWCRDIPDDVVFLKLYSDYGRIELQKYSDRIHAFKYLNGSAIIPHYASSALTITTGQEYMIYMRLLNDAIDLSVQLIT